MTEENYDSTGYGSLDDVKAPEGAGGHWLDFKQGRGDSAVVVLQDVIGVQQKQFRNSEPYQVLVMDIDVYERNGEAPTDRDGQPLEPGTKFRTNPKSPWCLDIKAAINELAKRSGWDGSPDTFARHAPAHRNFLMRWTRNDNAFRQGHIDVEILGAAPDTSTNTQPDQKTSEEKPEAVTPWKKPKSPEADMVEALNQAASESELDNIMQMGWGAIPKPLQEKVQGAYQRRLDVLQNKDIAF